ncbi:uncharacterized protein LOC128222797 [Mya arenaria]|uniref:uncharacterized protein LOC128222797 n=1 Tax=Mya arenaria TaxID=6604 RepID=UPI0022E371E7|nr:uncharacterized protein LOC128222797 [Mya arenaria]
MRFIFCLMTLLIVPAKCLPVSNHQGADINSAGSSENDKDNIVASVETVEDNDQSSSKEYGESEDNDKHNQDHHRDHAHDSVEEMLHHILHEVRRGHATSADMTSWMTSINQALADGSLTQQRYDQFLKELTALLPSNTDSMTGNGFIVGR